MCRPGDCTGLIHHPYTAQPAAHNTLSRKVNCCCCCCKRGTGAAAVDCYARYSPNFRGHHCLGVPLVLLLLLRTCWPLPLLLHSTHNSNSSYLWLLRPLSRAQLLQQFSCCAACLDMLRVHNCQHWVRCNTTVIAAASCTRHTDVPILPPVLGPGAAQQKHT